MSAGKINAGATDEEKAGWKLPAKDSGDDLAGHGREVRETARRIYAEERTALVARAIRAEDDRDRLWGDVGALAEQVAVLTREARRARAVESGLRALVDRPHNHGSPDCPNCQWQTRINALLEDDRA